MGWGEVIYTNTLQIKTSICEILMVLSASLPEALQDLFAASNIFMAIISLEAATIEKLSQFSLDNISYLMDTLLVLINQYASFFFRDQISMLFAQGDSGQNTLYDFALVLLNSLERMFFLTPHEVLNNPSRTNNIRLLSQTFSIPLPNNILPRKQPLSSDQRVHSDCHNTSHQSDSLPEDDG